MTLRSDVLIKHLLTFLDTKVGKGNYYFALSADHGVCPLPEFAKQHGLKQLMLSDFNHEAMKAYGVQDDNFIGLLHGIARRSVFVIDKNGKVVYTWIADQPGVEPPYDQVQAAVQKVNA